jgi:hypothetical protein
MSYVVERLLSKCEALSFNPSATKKQNKNRVLVSYSTSLFVTKQSTT